MNMNAVVELKINVTYEFGTDNVFAISSNKIKCADTNPKNKKNQRNAITHMSQEVLESCWISCLKTKYSSVVSPSEYTSILLLSI